MAQAVSRNELFETLPVPVALRRMIVPAAVSQIIVLIYNMADTFYIGRTNNPYMLAGASLILPVFNMLLCLSSLAGIGGGTLISRLLGVGMTPALTFLGAGENIFLYARQYAFCVIVLGAVPTVLSNVLAHLVRSVGMSREAGFGITLGAVLNIALDPVFMYLLLPDGQQVLGVGVATLLSNCVPAGISLWCCGASGKPRCSPPTRAPVCPSPGTWRPSLGWAFLRRWPACCSIWTTWSSTN